VNKAELRTLSKYFKINKQDYYFRVFTIVADKKKCMKKYNFVD